jgi:hypothetical protein
MRYLSEEERVIRAYEHTIVHLDEPDKEVINRGERIAGMIEFIYTLGWISGYECHRENCPDPEDLAETKG